MASETGATLSCRCGGVSVSFPTRQPAYCVECCCVDCYQKNAYFAGQRGATLREAMKEHGRGRPMRLSYFPAKLNVKKGREYLAFNRLRESSLSVNCVAKCCESLLFVDAPVYEGKVVLTFPDYCCNSKLGEDLVKPFGRAHIRDWPAEALATLPPLPATFFVDRSTGERVTEGGFMAKAEAGNRAAEEKMRGAAGDTFAELLAAAGGEIAVLGLPEHKVDKEGASAAPDVGPVIGEATGNGATGRPSALRRRRAGRRPRSLRRQFSGPSPRSTPRA